jgi:chorismate mutase
MPVRGIRGAVQADQDSPQAILKATRELLEAMITENPGLAPQEIASAWFTVTSDLHSAYPAKAARELGWTDVPLMDACEIPVPSGLERCIRVLIHWNTDQPQHAIRPVYLGGAAVLRPEFTRSKSGGPL